MGSGCVRSMAPRWARFAERSPMRRRIGQVRGLGCLCLGIGGHW